MNRKIILVVVGLLISAAFVVNGVLGTASLLIDKHKPSQKTDNIASNVCNWKLVDINGYTFDSVSGLKNYAESQGKTPNYSNVDFKKINGNIHARPVKCGDNQ